ncbi:hypothetical protein M3Y95_00147600 [Aphelenchoides besseyi]|nr:hypothetical protein M3Y95_00147600 [Aphelenchoides besseyi]
MRLRIRADEPSTSKTTSSIDSPTAPASPKRSPTSPVFRIAKRNAQLLNGLNTRVAAYSEQLGTMPEFSIRSIHELCPALTPAIGNQLEGSGGSIDNLLLSELQFQLENLLSENLNWQRNIHGERTFLETGDYPTDDLKLRPMPTYEVRTGTGRQTKKKSEPDQQQPSCSYSDSKLDEEDAASDVVSSMDERDYEEQPYCVLDIPHRFWTWAREYVGHIDEKFLRDFDQKFYQHYRPENMTEFFINEPFKYKTANAVVNSKAQNKHQLNGVVKEEHSSRRSHRHSNTNGTTQLNGVHLSQEESPKRGKHNSSTGSKIQLQESTDSITQTPEHTAELMKKLVAAYVQEKSTADERLPPKRKKMQTPSKKSNTRRLSKSGRLRIPTAKMKSAMNDGLKKLNGNTDMIGDILTDDEDDEQLPQLNNQLLEVLGTALAECVLPVSCNEIEANKPVDTESEMSVDHIEHEETHVDESALSHNMENYELINLNLGTKSGMDLNDLDDVSLELLKAQQRLETLVKKTTPALEKCKRELEAEHAHWMTTRSLNMIDDELFRLSSKLPANGQPSPELYKKCLKLWEARKRRLLEHHVRDHIKLVKLIEKLRLPNDQEVKQTPKAANRTPANRRQ